MQTLSLNGKWTLRGFGRTPLGPIPADVPGNIELALQDNGIVPDIFFGTNEKLLRPFEFYDWIFERTFDVPQDFPKNADIVFDGIDCIAEIALNGQKVAETDNAFIRHVVPVDDVLWRGRKNLLTVTVKSPVLAAAQHEMDHHDRALFRNYEGLPLRKPAHSFGWDICPRCCLGGIWRDVTLAERPANRIRSCYFDVTADSPVTQASIVFSYSFETDRTSWDMFTIDLNFTCKDHAFSYSHRQYFTSGILNFKMPSPRLWWPAGYGEQNLYDVAIRIYADGDLIIADHRRIGIRSLAFDYCEDPQRRNAQFVVNGVPIMVKGSNWVPADALHSRDCQRDIRILELFSDLGCNMLRVWGGGIYERPAFYDYCDEHGIMVWQDFMVACARAPQTDDFLARFRTEAEWAVKELRQHPSIALWAGDNEVDVCFRSSGKPSANRLTREILPQVLQRLDPCRPYLPSSPFISQRSEDNQISSSELPEQHIWGPRDYFKSPFYANNDAVFISETGYHGCPDIASLTQFLSPDKLWPGLDNDEWEYHACHEYAYRIPLMYSQIKEAFLMEPQSLEDFVLASQISQAEALKFFVENTRIHKWQKTGILWWNVMDCWPQFSDAVVDYYFRKKLAYSYLKRSQAPLLAIVGEWRNWGHEVVVTNDTMQPHSGTVSVTDALSGEILFSAPFAVPANENTTAGSFRLPNGDQRLLLLRWQTNDGVSGANHYISGRTPWNFQTFRDAWLPVINNL